MTTQTLCAIVRSQLQRSTSEDLDYLYSLGGDQFLEKVIKSNVNSGLSEDDDGLQRRSKQLGSNQLRESGPITIFLQQISFCSRDLTIRAIIILSTIAIIVDFQTEGISRCTQGNYFFRQILIELLMLTFCLISILVGAGLGYYIQINNQEDDNAPAYGEINVKVIRNGEVSEILDSQLLVGDLVVMQVGLPLSFDGILVSGELSVDESQQTGEANPAIKRPLAECLKARDKLKAEKEKHYIITVKQKKHPLPSPILLSGTKILEGEGKIIVLAVGARAQINQISILKEKLSPLQEKVMRVAEKFGHLLNWFFCNHHNSHCEILLHERPTQLGRKRYCHLSRLSRLWTYSDSYHNIRRTTLNSHSCPCKHSQKTNEGQCLSQKVGDNGNDWLSGHYLH